MRHGLADRDHQRPGQRTGRVVGADRGPVAQLGERGLDAALRAGGALRGDHARGGRVQAVLDQGARRVRQMLGGGMQSRAARARRPGGPVDVPTDIGDGVRRTEREAGIRRHRGAGGQAGQISKTNWVRATALTSASTESTDSGSPATSRTTSVPRRASWARMRATSAGSPSAGRMSGPSVTTGGASSSTGCTPSGSWPPSLCATGTGAGAGPDAGGSSEPTIASTCSGTSGSVNTERGVGQYGARPRRQKARIARP